MFCVYLLDLSVVIATTPTEKLKSLDYHGAVFSSASLTILVFSPFYPPSPAMCGSHLLVEANC